VSQVADACLFERILVPADGSSTSEAVILSAWELGRLLRAWIAILYVNPPPSTRL
jgi:nucleotide-binding universal stress UspA family protein